MAEELTSVVPAEEIIVLTTEVPDASSAAAPASAPAGGHSALVAHVAERGSPLSGVPL